MEDEWDRDLLHVTYNSQMVTVERMRERIAKEGFEAELKQNKK